MRKERVRKLGGGGKEGSQIEVEEGRGKPEEMGNKSGVAEEGE
jgi:hypothetical protein